MSALAERTKQKSGPAQFQAVGLPQVNLLPPEVRAARGLRAMKRWLVLTLLLVAVALVAAFGFSLITAGLAQADLAEAESDTARLQSQAAKYAEVPLVLGALSDAQLGQRVGMSTDIAWRARIDAIAAVLPAGTSISQYSVSQTSPTAPQQSGSGLLVPPGIGLVSFTLRSSTVPDAAGWEDAINSLPGFADAWVSLVSVTEDESGVYYEVTGQTLVTDAALSHRFDQVGQEG
jgi:hypothetical protein